MKLYRIQPLFFFFLCLHLSSTGISEGAVVITIVESGSNVVASGGGSIDITGLNFVQLLLPEQVDAGAYPLTSTLLLGDGSSGAWFYSGILGPSSMGSGGPLLADSFIGDLFGLSPSDSLFAGDLLVPVDYISDSPLAGTATFSNATLDSLGFDPGTYVWTWGAGENADALTIMIVPEPATAMLLVLGLAGCLAGRCRPQSFSTRHALDHNGEQAAP
jgi:hypothetical protein